MTGDTPGRGLFVTLEGPDGAGKSSQAERLVASLRDRGRPVLGVREPGGTPIGEAIRQLLLGSDGDVEHEPLTDALLFMAARAQLVADVIRPALADGKVVVCDRYADSTLAYQGFGAGLGTDWLRDLNVRATGGLVPDLTILLDLPTGVGLARRRIGPGSERTRFEHPAAHGQAFHERVREGYLWLARAEPQRWRIVDAARDPESVAAEIQAAVDELLARASGGAGGEPIGVATRISP